MFVKLSNVMNRIQSRLQSSLITALVGLAAISSPTILQADSSSPGARNSPDWLRSAVVYEIFPRNFSQEGTFDAITARLDELSGLGVDILWLMPIHPVGEKMKKGPLGSPYAVRDFYAISPDLGTTNDFRRLIKEAHKRNMKVVMDIVAGQTAWDSDLMAHPQFYMKNPGGQIIPPNPTWTDVAGLDYANPEVRQYMIDM